MNRIFIRMCGYILGVMGWFSTAQSSTLTPGTGVLYDDNTNYLTVSGFAAYNNTALQNKYCPSGQPATGGQECTTTPGPSGTGTSGGTTTCVDLANFPKACSGSYYCNTTGVYCTNTGFFLNEGVSYTGSVWLVASGGYKYAFAGCDTAYYQTSTGGYCVVGKETSNKDLFSGCCAICPMYVWSDNTGSTYINPGNVACVSGWCVESTGVGGITTCRAYLETAKSFTDTAGTYTFATGFAGGCPYEN